MQQFEITLKNDKVRLYKRLSWLIIFLNLVLFIYFTLFTEDKKIRTGNLILLASFAFIFFLTYYLRNTKYKFGFRPFFYLSIIAWIFNDQYWIAVALLLFDSLSFFSLRKQVVRVTNESIIYPSLPAKKIFWNDISNMILKDGLLTINLKNNKFFQQYIEDGNNAINEQDFNDFCKTRVR